MQEPFPKLPPGAQQVEPEEWGAGKNGTPVDRRSCLLSALLVLFLIGIGALLFNHLFPRIKATAAKTHAIQNVASSIKTALMAYGADHQDHFPDASLAGEPALQTSNQAFGRLFQGGYENEEAPFVIPKGAAKADGDISKPERILSKGENHYALAKGLLLTSKASLPLVWEAPLAGNWDPIWDSSRKRGEWGSTWSDGSVLVLTVGGSVATMKITRTAPNQKGPGNLAPTDKGQNPFQLKPDGDSLGPEW
jgi:type II secretory pathway pseudopilin PulG